MAVPVVLLESCARTLSFQSLIWVEKPTSGVMHLDVSLTSAEFSRDVGCFKRHLLRDTNGYHVPLHDVDVNIHSARNKCIRVLAITMTMHVLLITRDSYVMPLEREQQITHLQQVSLTFSGTSQGHVVPQMTHGPGCWPKYAQLAIFGGSLSCAENIGIHEQAEPIIRNSRLSDTLVWRVCFCYGILPMLYDPCQTNLLHYILTTVETMERK